jgi:hypothetical protein
MLAKFALGSQSSGYASFRDIRGLPATLKWWNVDWLA